MDVRNELKAQWQNPADILSLLLLIGGDVVQRAIAQMFGTYIRPFPGCPRVYLTPVAFSFGWVGYAFTTLAAVVSDKQLMPAKPDGESVVINCDNGYTRKNRSWLLERVIRDHELRVQDGPGDEAAKLRDPTNKQAAGLSATGPAVPVSMRIDIFNLEENLTGPSIDLVWVSGWITIILQLVISAAPWIKYGDWSIFLITGAGTLFALFTGSLRQWNLEKWPGRRLNNLEPKYPNKYRRGNRLEALSPITAAARTNGMDIERGQTGAQADQHISPEELPDTLKVNSGASSEARNGSKKKCVCLTRGNGHKHVMVIRGAALARDVESLATATSRSVPETKWCLGGLAILWTFFLISVSGIKNHTWFLILVGALGMFQNIYAASSPRNPECLGMRMTPYEERRTIIGAHVHDENMFWAPAAAETPDDSGMAADDPLVKQQLEPWQTVGVRGALRELEKTIPKAGIAIMPEFFPALWRIDSERYRDKREERFWRWMFRRPNKADR